MNAFGSAGPVLRFAETFIQVVWRLSLLPPACDHHGVPKNSENSISMETHESVRREEVGALVQEFTNKGALIIVVTQNPDGRTCTVSVQQD